MEEVERRGSNPEEARDKKGKRAARGRSFYGELQERPCSLGARKTGGHAEEETKNHVRSEKRI